MLLLTSKRPHYGYEIIEALSKYPIISTKESTIYPLLRRLLKEEYLTSFWQEGTEGLPPRKYYQITDKGRQYLSVMSEQWNHLTSAITELGDNYHG